MDSFYVFRFVMGCVEETVKNLFGRFTVELFKRVLKRNVYEILSEEDYVEGVKDILEKIRINYSFGGDEVSDEEREKYLGEINNLLENGDDFELTIDIPIGSVMAAVGRMVERGEIKVNNSERDLMRDLGIIDRIWEEWMPMDEFGRETKNLIESILENVDKEEL